MSLDSANSESPKESDNTAERLLQDYPSRSQSHAARQPHDSANQVVADLPKYPELAALDKAPAPAGRDPKKNENERKAAKQAASRKEDAQELASGLAAETPQGGGGLAVFQRSVFMDAHRMSIEKEKTRQIIKLKKIY